MATVKVDLPSEIFGAKGGLVVLRSAAKNQQTVEVSS